MALPDITALGLSDLAALKEKIEERAKMLILEKQEELQKAASAFGASPIVTAKAGKRAPAAVKYRDPADADNTWTGRGKKPRWLEAKLSAGAQVEDFLIN